MLQPLRHPVADHDTGVNVSVAAGAMPPPPPVPDYLEETYWWAYVRPWAVRFFEREWLVNLILWGNYEPLMQAALRALEGRLSGKTLQISCAYGNLSPRIMERAEKAGGQFEVLDVLAVQLDNLRRKIGTGKMPRMMQMDSTHLYLPDAHYDQTLLFFLMHEQPRDVREKSLAEAWRVLKPGGRLVIVDFARPKWWHPVRYLWLPILGILEPFAPDLWGARRLVEWLPESLASRVIERQTVYGSLFQVLILQK